MTHDTEFWGLEYCSTCIQMTNHDDNGCLKCRAKVAMADQELKRIMDSYHLGGYGEEYEEILTWHTRKLNEAKQQLLSIIEQREREARIDELKGFMTEMVVTHGNEPARSVSTAKIRERIAELEKESTDER